MSEMNRQAAPLLKIEGGSFAYKGGPQILKDINIEVEPGEILAVLGPNGSGKTTMLRCMMDMLHWQSGRSLLDGEDIRGIPASTLWKKMAYVPQAGTAATSYTAFQTVLIGRSSRIGAFSSPTEEPKLLVLDEPESNLDFKNQLIVLDTMTALAAEGVACVFNTHYPSHALQRAGKSLMLSKEGWSLFGDTTGVVTEDNIRRAFGVEALIGEVETPQNIMKNVVAVGISEEAFAQEPGAADRSVLASLTVIMQNNAHADQINKALREYNHLLIGRMGLPHRSSSKYIINVMLEGPVSEIEALSHRLSLIPDISVKTTYE